MSRSPNVTVPGLLSMLTATAALLVIEVSPLNVNVPLSKFHSSFRLPCRMSRSFTPSLLTRTGRSVSSASASIVKYNACVSRLEVLKRTSAEKLSLGSYRNLSRAERS